MTPAPAPGERLLRCGEGMEGGHAAATQAGQRVAPGENISEIIKIIKKKIYPKVFSIHIQYTWLSMCT